jgi:putative salt-induced outer membrane protein
MVGQYTLSQLRFYHTLLISLGLFTSELLFAKENYWQNEIDLGMLLYNGNNNAKHLNGSLLSQYEHFALENSFRLTGLLAVGRNTQTHYKERNAEKYTLTNSVRYILSEQHFAYLRGEGIRDHFSSYSYQFSESIGYGYEIFDSSRIRWFVSGGPGLRHTKVPSGVHQNQLIGHLESAFYIELTSNSSFKQSLTVDVNAKNTKSHTINELKTAILGPVAAKISFEIEHYAHLPKNSKFTRKTDATTKVTLSYSF